MSLALPKCPLSGVKRTWLFALRMSAFDPKRTHALQLKSEHHSITFVGASNQRRRHMEAERLGSLGPSRAATNEVVAATLCLHHAHRRHINALRTGGDAARTGGVIRTGGDGARTGGG